MSPPDLPLKEQARDTHQLRDGLSSWLQERLAHSGKLHVSELQHPKANGVSNETVIFDATWADGGRRRLVARLETGDPLYLDAGVQRQAQMYEALSKVPGVSVPEVIGYEPNAEILGTPFYVMELVEGEVPADNPHYTRQGWLVEATREQRGRVWRTAVQRLVDLHKASPQQVAFLHRPDRGSTGLEQDLSYWRASYRWAAEGVAYPVMESAERWLLEHLPEQPVDGVSWGDARIENMVFRDYRCAAMLDFESASLAGPEVDLAWWSIMDKGSARLEGLGTPQQTLDLYRELGGKPLVHLHYAMVLCAFRLAAIYIRLAAQLDSRGLLSEQHKDMAANSEKMQQLALLLGLRTDGPITASLPELDYLSAGGASDRST